MVFSSHRQCEEFSPKSWSRSRPTMPKDKYWERESRHARGLTINVIVFGHVRGMCPSPLSLYHTKLWRESTHAQDVSLVASLTIMSAAPALATAVFTSAIYATRTEAGVKCSRCRVSTSSVALALHFLESKSNHGVPRRKAVRDQSLLRGEGRQTWG